MKRRDLLAGSGAALMAGLTPWAAGAASPGGAKLLGYRRTNWSRDPFSFGSYSHIARNAWRSDHAEIAKPVAGKIFFAGEAANPDRNSSVHAALESGRMVAKQLLETGHKRIGVIGAGLSGLVAAHALSRAGLQVQVIEGRNRIGGRIHTDRSLGFSADLGASWLHGSDGNPLSAVTDRAGMHKALYSEDSIIRAQGRELPADDLPDWFYDIVQYDNHAGTEKGTLNIWSYLFFSDYSGDELLFPDGYDQIFSQFQGDYEITLNAPVRRVEYAPNRVRVTSGNAMHDFDAVIVTVPLGVLKAGKIAFSPALPPKKQRAIKRLGFGTLDKIYLQFDTPFWDSEVHNIITPVTDYPNGHYNTWVNLYPIIGKPVLVCFNGGRAARALSSKSDETLVQQATKTILKAYGQGA